MVIAGDTLPSRELYRPDDPTTGALYDTANSNRSLESLNGNLNRENVDFNEGGASGEAITIQPWMVQIGTFARGAYWGTDRWEYYYASQASRSTYTPSGVGAERISSIRIPIAGLSQQVFIPYKCTIIYGYQALFRHDATLWDHDDTPKAEYWDVHVRINDSFSGSQPTHAHRVMLPPGRDSDEAATHADIEDFGETDTYVGQMDEQRWRYVEKSGMHAHTGPGFFKFEVQIGAQVFAPDTLKAKTLIPTCAAWILAIR